jgi:hypothetical protein
MSSCRNNPVTLYVYAKRGSSRGSSVERSNATPATHVCRGAVPRNELGEEGVRDVVFRDVATKMLFVLAGG